MSVFAGKIPDGRRGIRETFGFYDRPDLLAVESARHEIEGDPFEGFRVHGSPDSECKGKTLPFWILFPHRDDACLDQLRIEELGTKRSPDEVFVASLAIQLGGL